MSVQGYRWLRPPSREGSNAGAFIYAYPNGDMTDRWRVRELSLTRGVLQHEFAVFDVLSATGDDWVRWDPYTPVQIDFGDSASNRGSFYGYLWKPDSEINQLIREPLEQRAMRFYALGSSYPMKQGLTQVFCNQTASNVAQAVASAFKFGTNITPTSYVWDQLAASGESYFSFMADVAHHQGRAFFVMGTTLYFLGFMDLAQQMGSQVPVYYAKDSKYPNPNVQNVPSVIHFQSDPAEMSEDPGRLKASWTVSGVNLSTGQAFSATDDGSTSFGTLVAGGKYGGADSGRFIPAEYSRFAALQNGEQPAIIADTQGDASLLIQTRSALNRFPIRAKAELFGNANMIPLQLISLYGLGNRHSGRWLVRSLTHHVVWKNWFSTEVEIMRDSDFDTTPSGVEPSMVKVPTPIPTVLVGGAWRAQYGVKSPTSLTLSVGGSPTSPPAVPTPTSNGVTPVGSITGMVAFANALLSYLGITPTTINVNLICAWQIQEGQWDEALLNSGYYPGGWAAWGAPYMCNPLNLGGWLPSGTPTGAAVTYDGFAATALNTAITGPTLSFNTNWTNGVAATGYFIQTQHQTILQALKTSNVSLFFSVPGVETWNPGSPTYYTQMETVYNNLPVGIV
jgi:hypothetical protein